MNSDGKNLSSTDPFCNLAFLKYMNVSISKTNIRSANDFVMFSSRNYRYFYENINFPLYSLLPFILFYDLEHIGEKIHRLPKESMTCGLLRILGSGPHFIFAIFLMDFSDFIILASKLF